MDNTSDIMRQSAQLDWHAIAAQLEREGYAVLAHGGACDPRVLYAGLLPIAARWCDAMRQAAAFVPASDVVVRSAGSTLAPGHFQPLVQDVSAHAFPFMLIAVLGESGVDFTGGELIMTEQRPRMQSRPIVVPLQMNDLAILCTGRRPVQGGRGIYTVSMRHAVGRVRTGLRIGQEWTFDQPAGGADA